MEVPACRHAGRLLIIMEGESPAAGAPLPCACHDPTSYFSFISLCGKAEENPVLLTLCPRSLTPTNLKSCVSCRHKFLFFPYSSSVKTLIPNSWARAAIPNYHRRDPKGGKVFPQGCGGWSLNEGFWKGASFRGFWEGLLQAFLGGEVVGFFLGLQIDLLPHLCPNVLF